MTRPLERKPVLCVAYFFPPVAVSGSHRTRAVVRHLPAAGWEPVVVTADDRSFQRDPALLHGLPENLVVYRTKAPSLLAAARKFWSLVKFPVHRTTGKASASEAPRTEPAEGGGWVDWTSWWLQVPDVGLGWLPWGWKTACRAARRHRCRAIYSSAPYFTTHLIALLTKWTTGLPWVADFRDPWRANPFRRLPYRSLNRYDDWLEAMVVRWADSVICNTEPVRRDFLRRFPQAASKFVTIPNGFEPDEFSSLASSRPVGPEKILLTHAGVFYGKRRPDPLFQALRILVDRHPSWRERLCLQLAGTPVYDGQPLEKIAAQYGVSDLVRVPGEVSHQRSLELLRGSDVQLLVGFSGAGSDLQVPGKLFEYLGIGRPILALAPADSAIADVITRSGIAGTICDPDDPSQIADAIERITLSKTVMTPEHAETLRQFTRREQVRRIGELLHLGSR